MAWPNQHIFTYLLHIWTKLLFFSPFFPHWRHIFMYANNFFHMNVMSPHTISVLVCVYSSLLRRRIKSFNTYDLQASFHSFASSVLTFYFDRVLSYVVFNLRYEFYNEQLYLCMYVFTRIDFAVPFYCILFIDGISFRIKTQIKLYI